MKKLVWLFVAAFALAAVGCGGGTEEVDNGGGASKRNPADSDLAKDE